MPIVTAVNGAAAGVGMSFAMMGDIVCASKQAFFLQAFARIGLVPDGGSTAHPTDYPFVDAPEIPDPEPAPPGGGLVR